MKKETAKVGKVVKGSDTIQIITGSPETRGRGIRDLKIEELSGNINIFLGQMNKVLEDTPTEVGSFRFVEFEINVEVTAKGSIAILGTGGEAGATGGLKFVFRRT